MFGGGALKRTSPKLGCSTTGEDKKLTTQMTVLVYQSA
jgi:hypothetical protein